MILKIENTIKALSENNINAIYAKDKNEIAEIVKNMLFKNAKITSGGSVSLIESGVIDIIKSSEYNYLDRLREGITPKEQLEVYRQVLDCDFYFCSSNAVTEKGELINVDGNCNRISAISFGPKRVVMVVGANKIVKDLNEGFLRVKKIAAPKNCVRLGLQTPCSKLGHCVSLLKSDTPDFTDGCNTQDRICVNYLISARQRVKDRITVIISQENLGY